ncbi:MAG: flavin oxidoreductase/NADH oxidase [Clostridia bacterium]|nr:flavin oxidoreductase/NADH oxidase [Clostridia bacterium]
MKKNENVRAIDYYASILKGTKFENDSREGLYIPYSEDFASTLGLPGKVGKFTAPNRIVYQPMEGQDADEIGNPIEITYNRYRDLARGGAGIIWVEAVSVCPEGRSNAHQLMITEENVPLFAKLAREIKDTCRDANGYEPIVIIQLNHSGRHSKPKGTPEPMIAHHIPERENPLMSEDRIVTDEYLTELKAKFVECSVLSERAGFDGVDIKCCHGYLYSELLSSFDREGIYGGEYEGRVRLLVDTVKEARKALKPDTILCSRLNVYDGYRFRHSFATDKDDSEKYDLTESIRLVGELEPYIDLLNITVGSPYYNSDVSRPYRVGVDVPPTNALRAEVRMFEAAREIHRAYPKLPCVNTGISGLCEKSPYAGAGMIAEDYTTFVGFGRMSFAYPSMAIDILKGRFDDKKCCVACSGCSTLKKNGLLSGCIIRNDMYKKIFREFRANNK